MMALHAPLSWLCDTSLRVSGAIALLLLLRPWLRKFGGNRALPWLWLVVALRLLLPWPIASPWSVHPPTWLRRPEVSLASGVQVLVAQPFHGLADGAERPQPASFAQAQVSAHATPVLRRANGFLGLNAWNVLWLFGVAGCLLNLSRKWRQTRRWFAQAPRKQEDAKLTLVFASLSERYRRGIVLRITAAVDVPAVSGVFRPQIWIPLDWVDRLSEQEWRHVLLHELGHVRRHDLLAQWVCSLACCVHWFNPLVWVAARLARADRELACDAWVLARGTMGGNEHFPSQYGSTLLKVVAQLREPSSSRRSPAIVPMANSKRNLSLRVREIGAFQDTSAWRGIAAALATASVMLVFTVSNAAIGQGTSEPSPAPTALPSPARVAAPPGGSVTPPPGASATATTLAVPPASAPSTGVDHTTSRKLFTVGATFVAVPKSSVEVLKEQTKQSPAFVELVNELESIFGQANGSTPIAPGTFPITQIISAEANQEFLQQLIHLQGVNLLSAPRVTTKSGQEATVEIIREILYPTQFSRTDLASVKPAVTQTTVLTPTKFEKKNTGLTLTISGDVSDAQNTVDLNVNWQSAELQGWVNQDGKPVAANEADGSANRPVFSTQTIETSVTMPSGATLLLASPPRAPGTWRPFDLGSPKDGAVIFKEDYVVLNFITVTVLDGPLPAVAHIFAPGAASTSESTDRERADLTAALDRKLQDIVIPQVEFHATALSDAIEFLRQESQRLDPNPDPNQRGVNIFLKVANPASTTPPATGPVGTAAITPTPSPTPRITLSGRSVPLISALRDVATQVGLKVKVEPYAVSLVPLSEQTDVLATREFVVAAETLGGPPARPADTASPAPPPSRLDARPWLQAKGITFPAGSSATYLVEFGKLVIRNTQKNTDRLTTLLAAQAAGTTLEPRRRADRLPYGALVEGKPGFVTSPYAPEAGYVDVRNLKPEQEVRDPYTGKLFVIP